MSILINNIPNDWEKIKIKYVFFERKEINSPIKTDILVSLTHDRGVILHSEKGEIGNKQKDDISKYKLVYPGDIVINSMNVIIGSAGLSGHYGLVSPVYYLLKIKNPTFNNKFFHYLFTSVVFQKSLVGTGNGILEHRKRIPIYKLGNQFIPIPSSNEQKNISRYLDGKTEKIDSLINKLKKKIELLKEQRTTLINHCVTKGLNPNVEMKASGLDWIGEIPKHWNVQKLKHLVTYNTEILPDNTDPDYKFHYVEIGDVNYLDGVTIKEKIKFYRSPLRARRVVKPSDIVVSTVRTYLKAIGVIPELDDVVCSTGFCVIRNRRELIDQDFLSFSVRSEWFISKVICNSYGTSYPAINSSVLVEIKIVVPPIVEQKSIVKHIKSNISEFNRYIELEEKRKTLLLEYRQSLISSVVTGKVRVRDDMI